MPQTSPAGWFRDVRYPAGRDMIHNLAKRNGAPQDVLDKIEQLDPQLSFRSSSAIFSAINYEGYEHIEPPKPENIPDEKLSAPGGTTMKTTVDKKEEAA